MSIQRNPYRNNRPWVTLPLRSRAGGVRDFCLIADTGSSVGFVLAPTVYDSFIHRDTASIRNNFGLLLGGWFRLYSPANGLVEFVRGYRSEGIGLSVASHHPDFVGLVGLVGLPVLRLGEYGNNATDF